MDDSINLDGKTRFGLVREIYNQDRNANEGITLEALAEKAHTTPSTLSRVENGKTSPSVDVLKAYNLLLLYERIVVHVRPPKSENEYVNHTANS